MADNPTIPPGRRVVGYIIIELAIAGLIVYCASGLPEHGRGFGATNRLTSVATVIFFGGLASCGLFVLKQAREENQAAAREAKLRNEHPNEPWMWEPSWAAGRIDCRPANRSVWIKMSVWCAFVVSGFLLYGGLPITRKEGVWALFAGVLTAWQIASVSRSALRGRKYGCSAFLSRSLPGKIGGRLTGTIHVDRADALGDMIVLRLSCVRIQERTSRTPDRRVVLRQIEQRLERLSRNAPTGDIPVSLSIPADSKPTGPVNAAAQISWQLHATGKSPGINYQAVFEVPVFAVEAAESVADASEENHSHWRSVMPRE